MVQKMGKKPILVLSIGDVVDDLECVDILYKPTKNAKCATIYKMMCRKCGRTKEMLSSTIRRHCGTTHKACGKGLKTQDKVFYSKWQAMRTRTTNPKQSNYRWYKNIGSDAYKNFIDFYDDLYPAFVEASKTIPKEELSLERIDNTKNYEPGNCTWISRRDQPKHSSTICVFEVTYPDGHTEIQSNVREFSKNHGLGVSTVNDCMNPNRATKQHRGYRFRRIGKLDK